MKSKQTKRAFYPPQILISLCASLVLGIAFYFGPSVNQANASSYRLVTCNSFWPRLVTYGLVRSTTDRWVSDCVDKNEDISISNVSMASNFDGLCGRFKVTMYKTNGEIVEGKITYRCFLNSNIKTVLATNVKANTRYKISSYHTPGVKSFKVWEQHREYY